VTGDDFDLTSAYSEMRSEELAHLGVGLAVDGRRRGANDQPAITHTADVIAL